MYLISTSILLVQLFTCLSTICFVVCCEVVGRGGAPALFFFQRTLAGFREHPLRATCFATFLVAAAGFCSLGSEHSPQTQSRNTLLRNSMAAKFPDYNSWPLEELRSEATKRAILLISKDGVKTLASKLRAHDRLMKGGTSDVAEQMETSQIEESDLSFDQRLQIHEREIELLELQRKIRQEEREAEREKREYERQRVREEEERSIREEERLKVLTSEKEEFAISDAERQQNCTGKPKFIKIREMRENEDIDDYFQIFEMTARAQSLPEIEWVGNLVPKLTEKAKSVYLEIPDPKCQDYYESKTIIIKGYELTDDHYRFRFRTSEKQQDEDFVQWGNRTRRIVGRKLQKPQGMPRRSWNK